MLRLRGLPAAVAALCLFGAPFLSAQLKVGVVNTQKAMLDTAEIQKAQGELEAQFKPRQEDVEKLRQELQGIQEQLQKMQGKLTPEAERELNTQFQRKQRDFQRKSEDLQSDVDGRRNDVLARVQQRMIAVIQKLSEEKGFDVVVDSSTTLYFKAALEFTTEATAAYDKTHPVK
jgi:outer membrane protein